MERYWVSKGGNGWELLPVQVDLDAETVSFERDGSPVTVRLELCARHNASHDNDWDDIGGMDDLHEAPLASLLRRRLISKKLYTWSGDVLISVNPYQEIPGLYALPYVPEPTPHIFSVAQRAWTQLLDDAASTPKGRRLWSMGRAGRGRLKPAGRSCAS